MSERKRLDYLDMAKGIGILLVVIGHLQGKDIFALSPYILPICTWIFSFHMPLFFIVSGILINYKKDLDKDLNVLAKRRFRGIMVPYYCFSVCYLSVVLYALIIERSIMPGTLFVNLWYVLSTYGMSVLWFLPALFLGELVFLYLFKKFDTRKSIIILLILTMIASFGAWGLQQFTYDTPALERLHEFAIVILRPILAAAFIAIGYFSYFLFREREKINLKEILLALLLLLIGIFFVNQNGGVDFRSLVQKNLFFYYLCACCGSFGIILLCKNCKPLRILKYFGANSLIIMAVHNNSKVLYGAMNLAMYMNQFVTRAKGYVFFAIIFLVIMLFSICMVELINRCLGFMVGKPWFLSDYLKKRKA